MPTGYDIYSTPDCISVSKRERKRRKLEAHKRQYPMKYDHYGKLKVTT